MHGVFAEVPPVQGSEAEADVACSTSGEQREKRTPQRGEEPVRKQQMVDLDDLQYAFGIAWPPVHRFLDKYGYGREIVVDPERGRVVPESVAEAAVLAFRAEVTVGRRTRHDYQRLETWGRKPRWTPST